MPVEILGLMVLSFECKVVGIHHEGHEGSTKV
jgi:hypothetical protein